MSMATTALSTIASSTAGSTCHSQRFTASTNV